MGLGQVFSRRHGPGKGGRWAHGRQDAILGRDGTSVRGRLYCRRIHQATSGIFMDARAAARYEDPSVVDFYRGCALIKKPPGDPARRQSQEESSVTVCRFLACLVRDGRFIATLRGTSE